jgi:hypothetical protein
MKKNVLFAGLAFVLFLAASAQISQKKEPPKPPLAPKPPIENTNDLKEPPPPPPAPPPPPPPSAPPMPPAEGLQLPDDYEAFLKRNPSVQSLVWKENDELIIRLKSGKEERYQLDNEKNRNEAAAKYGELPSAPPPPPPPPASPAPPKPPKKKLVLS